MSKIFISICIILATGLLVFIPRKIASLPEGHVTLPYVEIAGKKILVDIADTERERGEGLSGRTNLPENAGMLFIFEKEDRYGFWMKDMNFPIDILWIDKNFVIQDITKNATPESYPGIFMPRVPIQYVLEVNAGYAEKNNVKIGEKVIIPFPPW